ncbi:cytochrome P450 [soil metagenome]
MNTAEPSDRSLADRSLADEPLADELIARFDPRDPAFIADPYPVLAELREAAPIFWYEPSGQWLVTRWADVHAALRDKRLGRTFTHRYTHAELGRLEPDPSWADFAESERWSLLNLEPPDHTRIRALISKVFTPSSVAALRPTIETTADQLLNECRDRGRFDLLADYAQPYSVAVICSMLGVPASDTRLLLDWSHAIVKMYELTTTDAQREAANTAGREFVEYTRALIEEKRSRPDGLLVSKLVSVRDAGDRLSIDEIISTTIVRLNAGHEATVNTLGNGMRAFLRRPDQWQRVVSGEVPSRTAVEEMIRWDGPLQLFERWVLDEGVVVAGRPLAVGDTIAMLFGSANRDPDHFADPTRFDAGRGDATHVSFGGGTHFCIGAPLARLEVEVSLDTLVRLMPAVQLAAEPEYHPTFVIRGLTAVHLTTA